MSDTAKIFNYFYLFFTFAISMLLSLQNAYAENTLPLSVRNISIDGGTLNAEVGVYGKATDAKLEVSHPKEGSTESLSFYTYSKKAALNIGIIIDNSTLCSTQGLENWWTTLGSQLSHMVSSQSKLTLISFTGHSIELLAQGVGIGAFGNYRLQCDSKATSGSADRAINRFLSTDTGSNLKRAIWLISSGNLRLSVETIRLLKQAAIPVAAFVYNPALTELLPTIADDSSRALGGDLFHAAVLDLKSNTLPAIFYQVSASVPSALSNKTAITRFSVKKDQEALASLEYKLIYPAVSSSFVFYLIGFLLLSLSAAAMYYLYIRRKQNQEASFTPAYLTGLWTSVDEATRDKYKRLEIKSKQLDIGTHLRSAIPMVRPLGARKACLARITRTHDTSSQGAECSYKIQPFETPGYSPVVLNGAVITHTRNLAHGDLIQLGSTILAFTVGRK